MSDRTVNELIRIAKWSFVAVSIGALATLVAGLARGVYP